MKLIYKKMSLFDAPKGSYIVHACNAQGVWGSGIAVEFKKKFPGAFSMYRKMCASENDNLGKTFMLHDNDYCVTCMIVSNGYGKNKSPQFEILNNTEAALNDLLKLISKDRKVFYSNKFNSGFFGVPWAETEKILKAAVEKYDVEWIVCDPDLKT